MTKERITLIDTLVFEANTTDSVVELLNIPQSVSGNIYNIHKVNSLEGGVDKLKDTRFDVIIVDLSISNDNSIETFLSLLGAFSDVPVILLLDEIGEFDEPINNRIQEKLDVEHLVKGNFDAYLLRRTINFVIEKKLVRQQAKDFTENISTVISLTEDKERKRFARDLHDGLGQKLSALSMNLKALSIDIEKSLDNDAKHIFDKCLLLLENADLELRAVAHNIIPPELDAGLCRAVKNMCSTVSSVKNIKINVEADDKIELVLNKQIETDLYRVIQELFNNSLKHSEANKIDIKLYNSGNNLYLNFKDNGKGRESESSINGIGLKSAKIRIEALHGNFSIRSVKDEGCCIKVLIPLNP